MPAAHRGVLAAVVVTAMRSIADFERAPTWSGAPAETGALARMREQPIVASFLAECGNAVPTRMVARLAELALLLERLGGVSGAASVADRVGGFSVEPGEGCAAVETARGLLLHRARVADGRVAEYQIVAPTEWNFHPEGALVRGLEGALAEDEAALARDARLVVQALDPCVACRVEVTGA
jgi:Ni,Fe-hydrogenase I large subunit